MSYNRWIGMGRLVRDPELRQTASGISSCKITIAVDRNFAKQGEEKKTDFIQVQFWRQQAEFVSRYFSKGRMIHVEGVLQNNDYEKDGVKHYGMVVVADNVTFCGDKAQPDAGFPQAQQAARPAQPAPRPVQPAASLGDLSDFEDILGVGEIPF